MALFANGVCLSVLVLFLVAPLLLVASDTYMAAEDFAAKEDLKMVVNKTVAFDYYILELGWPPSICREEKFKNKCRSSWPNKYVIHGLWPSNDKTPAPEYCPDGEEFDLDELRRKVPNLNTYWPSLTVDQSNAQFWEYQWRKHGKCSNLGLMEYFKAGLKLYNQVKLSDNLKAIGVTPGNKYDPSDVVKKYQAKYKPVKPKLKCGKKTSKPLVEMMDKFQFRVKLNLKKVEAMTGDVTNCKTKPVEYPKLG